MRRDADDQGRKTGNGKLTTWAVGIVLASVVALATFSVREAWARQADLERRVTALEVSVAALSSANVEQHKQLLTATDRIEKRLESMHQ